jgi:cation diffusion facilitator family transporter
VDTLSAATAKQIKRVTWVGFWVNALLTVMKITFGLIGHSNALIADGVHSLSDFATDFIVIIFIGLAYRSADNDHPYGHGKFETFSTFLIGVALMGVALGICFSGIESVYGQINGTAIPPTPTIWALIVAAASIVLKEVLYHYTMRTARKVKSSSLEANAWHHRSDSVSSIATLIGVAAAYFLGDKWSVLDPLASIIIALFIAASAMHICKPAINELLEKSLPDEEVRKIERIITTTPGVRKSHRLRTRSNGHFHIIDCHVKVDPTITVEEGHNIASEVEQRLKNATEEDVITNIHIEPFRE